MNARSSRPTFPAFTVQIAGVHDQREASTIFEAGADLIGLPLRLPVHIPDLSEDAAERLVRESDRAEDFVVITYERTAAGLIDLLAKVPVRRVQMHGDISAQELLKFRCHCKDVWILKSLVVGRGPHSRLLDEVDLLAADELVDGFITDTHDPLTGADGATGRVHDWNLSRRIVERSPLPVILAGGLDARNVVAAVSLVQPRGVDAHTRVEGPDGRKAFARVHEFVARAKEALGAPRIRSSGDA